MLLVAAPRAGEAQSAPLCTLLPSPIARESFEVNLGVRVRNEKDDSPRSPDARRMDALLAIASGLREVVRVPGAAPVPTMRSRFVETDSNSRRYTPVLPGSVSFTLDASGNIDDVQITDPSVDPAADSAFGEAIRATSASAFLVGHSVALGGKRVRLDAFLTVRGAGAKSAITWAQVLLTQLEFPVYAGTPVILRPGNRGPQYPPELRSARKQGKVYSQFVVDATGQIERSSFRILFDPEPGFADAVKRWLLRTNFIPATIGGCAVRSLAKMPTEFSLQR